jgi:hypothetical protein
MNDVVIERIRAAAEELTGIPSCEPPADSPRRRSAGLLIGSAACVVALIVGLFVFAGTHDPGTVTQAGPAWSSMTVRNDVGQWLDLPAAPAGLRKETDTMLGSTVVCTEATITGQELTCVALEGRIGSNYFLDSAPLNTDETERQIEIRTIYIADVQGYLERWYRSGEPIEVRGHEGVTVSDVTGTTVSWSERPGTLTTLRASTASGLSAIDLAESLEPHAWPSALVPPMVAVDFDAVWPADDNNHPYALAAGVNGQECISLGYGPQPELARGNGATTSVVCADGDTGAWTVGTISELVNPDERPTVDAFAGLVPSSVDRVELTLEDGQVLTADALPVPGFNHNAWGIPTGQTQGSLLVGTLRGLDSAGNESFTEPIVAVVPTVNIDSICFQPGTTGIAPDLRGLDLRSAQVALHDAGLIIAVPVKMDHMPTVTEQEPAPGTDVGCGDVVLTYEETPPSASVTAPVPDARPASSEPVPDPSVGEPVTACTIPGSCGTYIVQRGDYPVGVAEKLCVTLTELLEANGWPDASSFPAPDVSIMIPPDDGRQTCPDPIT